MVQWAEKHLLLTVTTQARCTHGEDGKKLTHLTVL